jgi:hypothetical protein
VTQRTAEGGAANARFNTPSVLKVGIANYLNGTLNCPAIDDSQTVFKIPGTDNTIVDNVLTDIRSQYSWLRRDANQAPAQRDVFQDILVGKTVASIGSVKGYFT